VIVDGHVELLREQGGARHQLVLLGPGETVGVGSLLHTSEHTTSARALSRVALVELPREPCAPACARTRRRPWTCSGGPRW